MRIAIFALSGAALLACGNDDPVYPDGAYGDAGFWGGGGNGGNANCTNYLGSCSEFDTDSDNACIDFMGPAQLSATLKASCEHVDEGEAASEAGVWSNTRCPQRHSTLAHGCQMNQEGVCSIIWTAVEGGDEDDFAAGCAMMGGTVVTP